MTETLPGTPLNGPWPSSAATFVTVEKSAGETPSEASAIAPLRGTALMVFDPGLVFLLVDNLFGGDGRFHTRVEGRAPAEPPQSVAA